MRHCACVLIKVASLNPERRMFNVLYYALGRPLPRCLTVGYKAPAVVEIACQLCWAGHSGLKFAV